MKNGVQVKRTYTPFGYKLVVGYAALAGFILPENPLEEQKNLKEEVDNAFFMAIAGAGFRRIIRLRGINRSLFFGFVNHCIEAEMRCFKNNISADNAAFHFFKFAVVRDIIYGCIFGIISFGKRYLDLNRTIGLNFFAADGCCDVKKNFFEVFFLFLI